MNHNTKVILSLVAAAMLTSCYASDSQIKIVTPQQYLEHKMENRAILKKISDRIVNWEIQKEDNEYVYYGLKNQRNEKFTNILRCKKSDLLQQLPCYKEINRKNLNLGKMLVSRKEFWIGEKIGSNPYLTGGVIRNDTQWEFKIEDRFILITYRCKSSDNIGNRTERIVEIEIDKDNIKNRKLKVVKSY